MATIPNQVLLRIGDASIRRGPDGLGYRYEGTDKVTLPGIELGFCLPLDQTDVARLFKDQGKEWRPE